MNKPEKPYWFPAKRYGWGWGFPSTWQGRVVLAIFFAVVSMVPFLFDPNENVMLFVTAITVCAGVLTGVCYAKGEPPKWRWGDDKKSEQGNPQPSMTDDNSNFSDD